MNTNILITGSYCSLNNGDLAMVKGFVESLVKRHKNANVTVFSMYPNIAPLRYGQKVSGIPIEPKIKFLFRFGWLILSCFLYIILKRIPVKFIYGEDFIVYLNSDIVVDLSGDGYSDEMGAIATILHSLYLFPAIILRKKVYVCAQSIGPFYSWYTKAIAKWTLNRVDILTAREHITKKYLDSMLRRKTILTGDCAFLMDSKQSEKVDSIIKKNGLEYKKIIGISVSKRMSRWALPDISMKDKYNKIIEIIADFIDNQTVKKDIYIMLVPHVMGPPGKVDDRVVQRDVYKKVKNKRKVILIEEELMPDEMKELIGYSYVFIGARMHSLIAAISMGIPVIALGYSHKYIGLIGEVMDNFVIDLRKVESKKMLYMLIKKLKILNMENDFYCNKIACSISRLKVNAMKNIDFMANWIN